MGQKSDWCSEPIKDHDEKALDCKDAIDELNESLSELYEANFENIQEDFEHQLELIEHLTNTYETAIDANEAKGYIETAGYYRALQNVESENIEILTQELSALEEALATAMASGTIEEGSDSWYEMQISINEVKESIDEANLSILEFEQTIRELEWEQFDFLHERIEQLTKESDFLIELMEFGELYDEQGRLTDTGNATVGLHGLNYNIYMAQADKYAKEYMKIQKQLADDPYNVELIERREELLELQQEAIIAAEEEKEAIKELVEEGIDIELESLENLIDKYKDALGDAKNLFDYQRKVEDHTSEISTLRKQLVSYEGDDSDETRAEIQRIKLELSEAEKDLEESEYDQYIDDQEKLLDDLYLEYETILNQRLDNLDFLIEEMINSVNDNSDSINETLIQVGEDVGYTMTEGMQSIWDNSIKDTLSMYSDNFTDKLTSTNEVLNSIEEGLRVIVGEVEREIAERIAAEEAARKAAEEAERQRQEAAKAAASYGGYYDGGGGSSGGSYTAPKPTGGNITSSSYSAGMDTSAYWSTVPVSQSSGTSAYWDTVPKKYASGGIADYTGLAFLDGTPQKPELVLDPTDTANFIELKDVLRQMSGRGISLDQSSHNISNVTHSIADMTSALSQIRSQESKEVSTNFGDINVTIPIEHVNDYNDFVNQLRDDQKFEKMIQDITVNQILPTGSSLAKKRHRW